MPVPDPVSLSGLTAEKSATKKTDTKPTNLTAGAVGFDSANKGLSVPRADSDNTTDINGFYASMGEHRKGELTTVEGYPLSNDAVMVINAVMANQGARHV
jgi:hypothetical protein